MAIRKNITARSGGKEHRKDPVGADWVRVEAGDPPDDEPPTGNPAPAAVTATPSLPAEPNERTTGERLSIFVLNRMQAEADQVCAEVRARLENHEAGWATPFCFLHELEFLLFERAHLASDPFSAQEILTRTREAKHRIPLFEEAFQAAVSGQTEELPPWMHAALVDAARTNSNQSGLKQPRPELLKAHAARHFLLGTPETVEVRRTASDESLLSAANKLNRSVSVSRGDRDEEGASTCPRI